MIYGHTFWGVAGNVFTGRSGVGIIMDKKTAVHKIQHNTERTIHTFQFIIFAILCGLLIGVIGVLFHECIDYVTELRLAHPQILLLLPFGAVLILFLYRRTGRGAEGGTNLIISSIQSGKTVPLRMAPLIFIATTISHLAGASVGREGAALQLGGSIGHYIASAFHFPPCSGRPLRRLFFPWKWSV